MFVIAKNNSSLPQNLKVPLPKLSAWPAVVNYALLCFCDGLCEGCRASSVSAVCSHSHLETVTR